MNIDDNLRYAILEKLRYMGLFQFDKDEFFKNVLKKKFNDNASYNYEPYEPVENHLKAVDLLSLPLDKIETISWCLGDVDIIYDICNFWDGEDEYFNIDSLENIDICKNLKEIKFFGLWSVEDLSPLKNLSKLEKLKITNFSETEITSLSPLLELPNLKQLHLSEVIFKNPAGENSVISELKKRGVEVAIK